MRTGTGSTGEKRAVDQILSWRILRRRDVGLGQFPGPCVRYRNDGRISYAGMVPQDASSRGVSHCPSCLLSARRVADLRQAQVAVAGRSDGVALSACAWPFDILTGELRMSMALCGAATLSDLDRSLLRVRQAAVATFRDV